MATQTITNIRIKNRYDNAGNWSLNNPILQQGEIGYDSSNNSIKIGDGSTRWDSLNHITASSAIKATQDASGNVITSTYAKAASLAAVATSGSYEDLTNKPTIPSEYTLPTASASVLGGIKIGENLNITSDGILSAIAGSSDNAIDELLFQNKYTSNVKYISNIGISLPYITEIYFPKCEEITNASLFSNNQISNSCNLHFSIINRKAIKNAAGYPQFGNSNPPSFLYDIDAIKMNINQNTVEGAPTLSNIYIYDEEATESSAYIPKSIDAGIVMVGKISGNDNIYVKTDIVNSDTEFTYNAGFTSIEGSNIGINKLSISDSYNATYAQVNYSYTGIDFLSIDGTVSSNGYEFITPVCATGTTLNANLLVDTNTYLYIKKYTNLNEVKAESFSIDKSEFNIVHNYLKFVEQSTNKNSYIIFDENAVLSAPNDWYRNNTSLTSIDLPNVTSIGTYAFYDCTSLTSIDLPNVTSIDSDAFYGCTSLTSIDLPKVTSIGSSAFYGCSKLSSITNLDNVTSIDSSAFRSCTSLTSIDLPNVTSIGTYAFNNCTSLTSIDLPNVTSIGYNAFYGCTSLTSIDLPNVTSIGIDAFYGCSKLTAIHFSAANKSKIEANSYYSKKWGATNATIYFDL